MLPAAESCMKNYWRYVLFLFALLLLNCIAGKDDNEYNCNYDIKNIEISGYENADIIILYFDLKGRAQTLGFDFEMTGAGINLNNEQLTFFESNMIDCFEYTSVDYHMSDLENSDGTEIRLKDLEYKTVTLKFTFYYREWIDSYDYRVKKGNTMTRSYKFGKLTCDPAPEPDKAPSLKAEVVSEECKINFDIGNICSNCQIYFWSSIDELPNKPFIDQGVDITNDVISGRYEWVNRSEEGTYNFVVGLRRPHSDSRCRPSAFKYSTQLTENICKYEEPIIITSIKAGEKGKYDLLSFNYEPLEMGKSTIIVNAPGTGSNERIKLSITPGSTNYTAKDFYSTNFTDMILWSETKNHDETNLYEFSWDGTDSLFGRIFLDGDYLVVAEITSSDVLEKTASNTRQDEKVVEIAQTPSRRLSFGVDYTGRPEDIAARDSLRVRPDSLKKWQSITFLDSAKDSHRNFDWIESKSIAINFNQIQEYDNRRISGEITINNMYQEFYRDQFSIFSYMGHGFGHAQLGGAFWLRETTDLVFPACSTIVLKQDCILTGTDNGVTYSMLPLNFACKDDSLDYIIKKIQTSSGDTISDTTFFPLDHVRLAVLLACSSAVGKEPSLMQQMFDAGVDCVIGTNHKLEHVFAAFFNTYLQEELSNTSSPVDINQAASNAFSETIKDMKTFLVMNDVQLRTYIGDGFDGKFETTLTVGNNPHNMGKEKTRETPVHPPCWGVKTIKP